MDREWNAYLNALEVWYNNQTERTWDRAEAAFWSWVVEEL